MTSTNAMLTQFISGALMIAAVVIGLYFLKFWSRTRDRLFGMFAFAFFLLGLERIFLSFTDPALETRSYIFLFRLCAFVIILVAIWDKNRDEKKARESASTDWVAPSRLLRDEL